MGAPLFFSVLEGGTLSAGEKERHLGLADADLMLRTVQAEFSLKNMFSPRA